MDVLRWPHAELLPRAAGREEQPDRPARVPIQPCTDGRLHHRRSGVGVRYPGIPCAPAALFPLGPGSAAHRPPCPGRLSPWDSEHQRDERGRGHADGCGYRCLRLSNAGTRSADEARLLAPIITDEILIRLLRGPLGTRVAQIGHAESALRRITKSVAWIRTNFTQQINVDTLAALASMSLSTFHHHFKCATGMSPVQFQKSLRLQEAKRLLATTDESAALVSRLVGYASPSQFSREYARQFGAPPSRDPSVSGSSAVAR